MQKKCFLSLTLAFAIVLLPATVYAEEQIITKIQIEAPLGGLEDGVISVPATMEGFSNTILFRRRMFDQHDVYMPIILEYGLENQHLSRGSHWRLRDADGNYTEGDYFINTDFDSPYIYVNIGPNQSARTMILTVSSLARPEVYSQIKIVVDPDLPAIFIGEEDGEIREGLGGAITVPIGVRNIPNGLHKTSVIGIADGISIDGWHHEQGYDDFLGYFNFAVGYLDIIDSLSTLTLTSLQEARYQARGTAILRIYLEEDNIWCQLPIPIRQPIYQICLCLEEIVRPPNTELLLCGQIIDNYGYWVNDTDVLWSMAGAAEGDNLTPLPSQHAMFSIGDDMSKRIINITVASVADPSVYHIITANIDPSYTITPSEVTLRPLTNVWQAEGIASHSALAMLLSARDQQGRTMPATAFSWNMTGAAEGDRLNLYPWGAVLHTDNNPEQREILITSYIPNMDRDVYDHLSVFVNPSLNRLPTTSIELEGTLNAAASGSVTLTVNSPISHRLTWAEILNLPTGLTIENGDWDTGLLLHGIRRDYGRLSFDEYGIDTIVLKSDGSLPAGSWDVLMLIGAVTFDNPHEGLVVFTLTVEP